MPEKLFKNVEYFGFRSVICGLLIATLLAAPVAGQATDSSAQAKAIISPTGPMDSRGDTVYEAQGKHQQDLPVVPGILIRPVPIKQPKVKYPKSLRGSPSTVDVVVEGIATPSGGFIDARIIGQADPEASANALASVSHYKFNPATLDGKPVAFRLRVIISFHYEKKPEDR